MSRIRARAVSWTGTYALDVLRLSFGVLFLWLGVLKLVPGVSPAEPLMRAAMPPFVPIDVFIRFAAAWEILVGLGFLSGLLPRVTLVMTLATMVTTLSIPWMAPGLVWRAFPFVLTFEGEYVFKDLVIASAALVLAVSLSGPFAAAERRVISALPLPHALHQQYTRRKVVLERWARRHHRTSLRMAFGCVFFVFGALKLVPGTSALEPLTRTALPLESFNVFYSTLGAWEMLVGLAIMTGRAQRLALLWVLVFCALTTLSVFLRPDLMFGAAPGVLTLLGQHMLKNVIFTGAALVLLTGASPLQVSAMGRPGEPVAPFIRSGANTYTNSHA
jgi:uncharacterized membrane protein YphA (DoxX/SURF4 family)